MKGVRYGLVILGVAILLGLPNGVDDVRAAPCHRAVAMAEWGIAGTSLSAACQVVQCESGGDASADSNSPYIGLFQIAPLHAPHADLYDPYVNVAVAFELFQHSGAAPWPSCGRFFSVQTSSLTLPNTGGLKVP